MRKRDSNLKLRQWATLAMASAAAAVSCIGLLESRAWRARASQALVLIDNRVHNQAAEYRTLEALIHGALVPVKPVEVGR